MAEKSYKVEHEDGIEWASGQKGAPVEVGDTIEADLDAQTETAVIAAGWVSEATTTKKKGG